MTKVFEWQEREEVRTAFRLQAGASDMYKGGGGGRDGSSGTDLAGDLFALLVDVETLTKACC
jgi:hypothetical protein